MTHQLSLPELVIHQRNSTLPGIRHVLQDSKVVLFEAEYEYVLWHRVPFVEEASTHHAKRPTAT